MILPTEIMASPSILCVDNQSLVGDVVFKFFKSNGYLVDRAADAQEAWDKISAAADRFNVLVAEHEMKPFSALELVRRIRDTAYVGRIIVHAATLTGMEIAEYRSLSLDALITAEENAKRLLGVAQAFHGEV